ncbi:hypothetical protein [Luteibacter sp. UNCMF366Tsu5.1]|uniref:hypothetical protein n=1 Tax=Luteibacter sp. UNCMF366Tsu5.1 TaxID=1502758 RepID=UPI00090906E9|nr:hypothetical protein [Luteibacter sp. UNCMF366Tsu5.1]SFW31956.1 hypothetical protein SAMN02800691_1005 [Luteibacter sp. UNCMF366Tsu5.1]
MPTSHRISFIHRRRPFATAILALTFGYAHTSLAANLPPHFDVNAKADVASGLQCVVGNATDADGMNARAWVAVEDAKTQKVRWATPVPLAKGWYQNQATHCLVNGKQVQALIQSDTASDASSAQTFVDVASFDMTTGRLLSVAPVVAPGVHGRVSLSVDKDASHFELKNGQPVVTGTWTMLPDRAEETPFTASPSPAGKRGH